MHEPGQCSLLNANRSTNKPKFINCNENHSANYRGCQYYINIKENIQSKKNETIKKNITSQDAFIRKNVSFANILGNKSSTQIQVNKQKHDRSFINDELQNLFKTDLNTILDKAMTFIPEYKKINNEIGKKNCNHQLNSRHLFK